MSTVGVYSEGLDMGNGTSTGVESVGSPHDGIHSWSTRSEITFIIFEFTGRDRMTKYAYWSPLLLIGCR